MRLSACFALIFFLGAAYIPAPAQKTAPKTKRKAAVPARGLAELQKMAARFAPTPLRVDISRLSAGDRQALAKLIEAGRLLNPIFLKQYWSGNLDLYARLQKDTTPLGKARLRLFWINKGPWSAFDDYRPFIPGVPAEKPPGSNFYPEDMTRQDFETWIASLPKEAQDRAHRFFTALRCTSG